MSVPTLDSLTGDPRYSALTSDEKLDTIRKWESEAITERNTSGNWSLEDHADFEVNVRLARQGALGITPQTPDEILRDLVAEEEDQEKELSAIWPALKEVKSAESEKREINRRGLFPWMREDSDEGRLEAADDKIEAVKAKEGDTEIENARRAAEALDGKRDAAVVRGQLIVNPDLYFDHEKFVEIVNKSSATPKEKRRVLAGFNRNRENIARQEIEGNPEARQAASDSDEFQANMGLRNKSAFEKFTKEFGETNPDATYGDVLEAFKKSGVPDAEKRRESFELGFTNLANSYLGLQAVFGDLHKRAGTALDKVGLDSAGRVATLVGEGLQDQAFAGAANVGKTRDLMRSDIEKLGGQTTGQRLIEVGGQLTGDMTAMLLSGGLSGGASVAAGQTVARTGAAATAKRLSADAAKVFFSGTGLVTGASSGGTALFDAYNRRRDKYAAQGLTGEELETKAREESVLVGLRTGIITSAVTSAFGLRGTEALVRLAPVAGNAATRAAIKKTAMDRAADLAKGTVSEAVEEALDEGINGGLDALLENPDMSFEEWQEAMIFAGSAGALFGGATEVATTAAETILDRVNGSPAMQQRTMTVNNLRNAGMNTAADALEQANQQATDTAIDDAVDELEVNTVQMVTRLDEIDTELAGIDPAADPAKHTTLREERDAIVEALGSKQDPAEYDPVATANRAVAEMVDQGADVNEARAKVAAIVNQNYRTNPVDPVVLATEAMSSNIAPPSSEAMSSSAPVPGAAPAEEVAPTNPGTTTNNDAAPTPQTFADTAGKAVIVDGEHGDIRIDEDGTVLLDRGKDALPIVIARQADADIESTDFDLVLDTEAEQDEAQAATLRKTIGGKPTAKPIERPAPSQTFVRDDGAIVTSFTGAKGPVAATTDFVNEGETEAGDLFVTVKDRETGSEFELHGDDALIVAMARRNTAKDANLSNDISQAVPVEFDRVLSRLVSPKANLLEVTTRNSETASQITDEKVSAALDELAELETQIDNEVLPEPIKERLRAVVADAYNDIAELAQRRKAASAYRAPAPRPPRTAGAAPVDAGTPPQAPATTPRTHRGEGRVNPATKVPALTKAFNRNKPLLDRLDALGVEVHVVPGFAAAEEIIGRPVKRARAGGRGFVVRLDDGTPAIFIVESRVKANPSGLDTFLQHESIHAAHLLLMNENPGLNDAAITEMMADLRLRKAMAKIYPGFANLTLDGKIAEVVVAIGLGKLDAADVPRTLFDHLRKFLDYLRSELAPSSPAIAKLVEEVGKKLLIETPGTTTPVPGSDLQLGEESDSILETAPNKAIAGSPDTAMSPVVEPGFYSKLERVVEDKLPEMISPFTTPAVKGRSFPERTTTGKNGEIITIPARTEPDKEVKTTTAYDTIHRLITEAGVKEEEIKWSGLRNLVDRLASENEEGLVKRADLLTALRAEGRTKFEEVRNGSGTKTLVFDRPFRTRQYLMERIRGDSDLMDEEGNLGPGLSVVETPDGWNLTQSDAEIDGTKFGQYQLPGGTNYREVVLSMPLSPTIDASTRLSPEESGKMWAEANGVDWDSLSAEEKRIALEEIDDTSQEETNTRLEDIRKATPQTFVSSHFPSVPNYIAHMRLNERDNGLFIEEIQSDRHQAGKKQGYKGERNNDSDLALKVTQKYVSPNMTIPVASSILRERGATEEELAPVLRIESNRSFEPDPGVPDAPFRQSREWGLHLFKRALRDAVESGKDWIGWTTGDTQNDRYDLSKQVDRISLTHFKAANKYLLEGFKDGKTLITKTLDNEAEVEKYIGKDPAKRLLEKTPNRSDSRSIEGNDLKVGGSGMKGFYDTILVNEIGKYVKQWGATVEQGNIKTLNKTESSWEVQREEDGRGGFIWEVFDSNNPSDQIPQEFTTKREALDFIKTAQIGIPIWRIEITPEMREGVLAGQPLFTPPATPNKAPKERSTWRGTIDGILDDTIARYPKIQVTKDTTLPSPARTLGLRILVNPDETARYTEGMEPADAATMIEAIFVHEAMHRSAVAEIGEATVLQYANAMTVDERTDVAFHYLHRSAYPTDEAYLAAINDFAGNNPDITPGERSVRNYRLGHEALRMSAERLRKGFTTEETLAFLQTNPNNLQRIVRYLQAYVRRMQEWMKNRLDPIMGVEIRRLNRAIDTLTKGPQVERGKQPVSHESQIGTKNQWAFPQALEGMDAFSTRENLYRLPQGEKVWIVEGDIVPSEATLVRSRTIEVPFEEPVMEDPLDAAPVGIWNRPRPGAYVQGGYLTAAHRWDRRIYKMLEKARGAYNAAMKSAEFHAKKISTLSKQHGISDDTVNAALGNIDNRLDPADVTAIKQIKRAGLSRAQGAYLSARNHAKQLDQAGLPADAALHRQQAKAAFDAAVVAYTAQADTFERQARIAAQNRARAAQATALATTPQDLQDAVTSLRIEIDQLSRDMIANGDLTAELQATISANTGLWLHRSYQIFDDPNYAEWIREQKDPEARRLHNHAINFIRQDLVAKERARLIASGQSPAAASTAAAVAVTDQHVRSVFDDYLSVSDRGAKSLLTASTVSKEVDALRKRGVIPDEIQELWGVYKDPTINAAKSIGAIAQYLAIHEFYKETAALGVAEGWLKKPDPLDPASKYDAQGNRLVELLPNNGMSGRFGNTPNTQYAPLSGYWGPQAMADALAQIADDTKGHRVMRFFQAWTGYAMWAVTAGSWQSAMRNFLGNILPTVMNGNLTHRHYKQATELAWAQLTNKGRKGITDEVTRLVSLGVLGDSITANLIRDLVGGYDSDRKAVGKWGRFMEKSFINALVKKPAAKIMDLSGKGYNFPDEFWKIVNFYGEERKVRGFLPNAPAEEISTRAAEIVRNTMPTYSRAFELTKVLRRLPFLAPFITFPSEMIRITGGQVKTGLDQIIEGHRTGNNAMAAAGYRRLFWMGATSAIVYSFPTVARFLAGFDREDEDDLREHLAPWEKNTTLLVLKNKDRGKGINYMNLSYMNPYDIWLRPIRAVLRGSRDPDQGALTITKNALGEIIDPVAKEQLLFGAVIDTLRGVTATGYKVYDKGDSDLVKMGKIANHIYEQAIEPGTVTSIQRVEKAATGYVGPQGRAYSIWNETVSALFGVKVQTVDIRTTLRGGAKEFSGRQIDGASTFSQAFKSSGTQRDEDLLNAYTEADDKLFRAYKDLRDKAVSAVRLGAMTREEAIKELRANGLSKETVADIVNNRYRRYTPSKESLLDIREKGLKLGQDRIEIYRRAIERVPPVRPLSDDTYL